MIKARHVALKLIKDKYYVFYFGVIITEGKEEYGRFINSIRKNGIIQYVFETTSKGVSFQTILSNNKYRYLFKLIKRNYPTGQIPSDKRFYVRTKKHIKEVLTLKKKYQKILPYSYS